MRPGAGRVGEQLQGERTVLRPEAAHDRAAKGAAAEQAVADHLLGLGLTLLGRNVRVGRLEIDLLVRDGPVVAIVEVRTRGAGSWLSALDSIDAGKRARLRRAATILWSRRFARMAGIERMRFDVASVRLEGPHGADVEYVRGAF